MILHIKNMVCPRCIMAVTSTLSQLGLTPDSVSLGEAHIAETPDQAQLEQIRQALIAIGFDLVENKSDLLIQRIKQSVLDYVRHDKCTSQPLSEWLATTLHADYPTLSRAFAAAEGRTIEKYHLLQRMEYVKELITYGDLSIKEIAWRTGFSSVAHLSRQFKQLTGMTPTAYKACVHHERQPLDTL